MADIVIALVVAIPVIGLSLWILAKGIVRVPAGERAVVFVFGAFRRILGPGVYLVSPWASVARMAGTPAGPAWVGRIGMVAAAIDPASTPGLVVVQRRLFVAEASIPISPGKMVQIVRTDPHNGRLAVVGPVGDPNDVRPSAPDPLPPRGL